MSAPMTSAALEPAAASLETTNTSYMVPVALGNERPLSVHETKVMTANSSAVTIFMFLISLLCWLLFF